MRRVERLEGLKGRSGQLGDVLSKLRGQVSRGRSEVTCPRGFIPN